MSRKDLNKARENKKVRLRKKAKVFHSGMIPYEDYLHMQSITQELKAATA